MSEIRPDGIAKTEAGATPGQIQPENESAAQREILTDKPLPDDALIILPVRNLVLFPGVILPITVGRKRSIAAAQEAMRSERPLGVVLQRDAEVAAPGPGEFHMTGTVAAVVRYLTAPDGSHHVVCQGEQRFQIKEFLRGYPFFAANIERIEEPAAGGPEIEARMLQVKQQTTELLSLMPQASQELIAAVQGISSASALADLVASFLDLKIADKQQILETIDLQARLDLILQFIGGRLEVLRLSHEIGKQTQQNLEERQREHLLREQLKTIQKELGDSEDNSAEIADLEKAIADARMPEEVDTHAKKELRRLQRMPEAAGEYPMLRTYLDWLVELPWSITTAGAVDINEARKVLDQDHYGLDKIKRRILEYLAVRKLNPEGNSPILCFVGPPGVGKTSLGQSIAKATNRKFVRASLGGVHDEAELRGHRRTYIGALPGNIIQGLRRAGARDCVFMLDEMDKLGQGFHGDPASALLEVLDPEQNNTFRDNYLAVPFDLSKVLFVATANVLDTIPGPLRDRMEIIQLSGYTEQEKMEIAHRYLVQRQMTANGLQDGQAQITDAALHAIIHDYTREAGVRSLERTVGAVLRNVAMRIAEGTAEQVTVDVGDLHAILGARRFESEVAMRAGVPGVATGLAWTPVGGDILFIEATRIPGSGKLILTGQLGDVMKESAQAALSLVKSKSADFLIPAELFEKNDIHIHVPAGATPKDGPSAGVAMFTALVSLMTDNAIKSDTAMTGEISLRGLVLPVGGIKEKVIAAMRAGITTVLLPARNQRDFEEIPAEARDKLKFVWLERVEDAAAAAFNRALVAEQESA
ncbi:MAG: endopeptidase La [Burkholderiales bacterium]|nr:endopeptidase La [Burkholderiales bacterium]MDQ3195693.1 endopeptidase La [Pseudomonadota bacterium]